MPRHQKAVPIVHDAIDPGLQVLRAMPKNSPYRDLIDPMISVLELSKSGAQLEHQRQSLLQSITPNHENIKRIDKKMDKLRNHINQELSNVLEVYELYYKPFGTP